MVQGDLRIRYNTRENNKMREVKETIVTIERNMKDIGLTAVRDIFQSR
jgi:hypothetical protein